MSKYIDSEKLVVEIKRRRNSALERQENLEKIGQKTVLNKMIAFNLDKILSLITSLQQKQPEVDLEKEIKRGWEELEKDYSPSALDKSYIIVSGLVGEKQFSRIARHFYELGLNARKEE